MTVNNFMDLLGFLPEMKEISPNEIPDPYRGLLVHDRDMTGTLERYYRETIHLHTLERFQEGEHLFRSVLLKTGSGLVVELGAIQIRLAHFSGTAQERVLGCYQPLGGILNEFGIAYQSRLGGFITLETDASLENMLEIKGPANLFGRRNKLVTPANETIAEVVEILPTEKPAV